MTFRSITHQILRVALAMAVLVQTALAAPVGACGVSGSCCTESSGCQDSGCCCTQADQSGPACCHEAVVEESAGEANSCCHSADDTSSGCKCHCSQPPPAPVAPPADTDGQIRLIQVYAYLSAAGSPALAIPVAVDRAECQSSLLKTTPRSVQVLFCTWLA